jgi:hypothetical protein
MTCIRMTCFILTYLNMVMGQHMVNEILFLVLTINFNQHVIMNMTFSSNMYAIQTKCFPEDGLLAQNI